MKSVWACSTEEISKIILVLEHDQCRLQHRLHLDHSSSLVTAIFHCLKVLQIQTTSFMAQCNLVRDRHL